MIKLAVQTIFYILLVIHGLFSLVMVYILLRYGKSKLLSLSVSAVYAIIITALYATALANFHKLTFPEIQFYAV